MNPQQLFMQIQVLFQALAREQQARDQLEAALAASQAEVAALKAGAEAKPSRKRRTPTA